LYWKCAESTSAVATLITGCWSRALTRASDNDRGIIEIQGYASKVGASEYNLELSKKRAHHVEDELLSNGIDPSRVRVVGYGENRLESDGNDATSHALNRRVTATVVGLNEQIVEEWTIFTTLEK